MQRRLRHIPTQKRSPLTKHQVWLQKALRPGMLETLEQRVPWMDAPSGTGLHAIIYDDPEPATRSHHELSGRRDILTVYTELDLTPD